MGFIKWPQIYAAEAEKLKGGSFNDRKCIMVSYDLPIVCYCREFFFEKINKVCLDFLEVKILTS